MMVYDVRSSQSLDPDSKGALKATKQNKLKSYRTRQSVGLQLGDEPAAI